jgi:hypothetical protein
MSGRHALVSDGQSAVFKNRLAPVARRYDGKRRRYFIPGRRKVSRVCRWARETFLRCSSRARYAASARLFNLSAAADLCLSFRCELVFPINTPPSECLTLWRRSCRRFRHHAFADEVMPSVMKTGFFDTSSLDRDVQSFVVSGAWKIRLTQAPRGEQSNRLRRLILIVHVFVLISSPMFRRNDTVGRMLKIQSTSAHLTRNAFCSRHPVQSRKRRYN